MFTSNRFMVKEQVKFLASHHTYDIFDGESQQPIGVAEEKISSLAQLLRWFISKQLMPTRIEIRTKPDNELVFTIRRGVYLFRARVEIRDADGTLIGYLKSKFFTFGGGFHIYNSQNQLFAEVIGNFIGFDYRLVGPDGKSELGKVTKKWTAVVQELFTSADTYMVEVNRQFADEPGARMLVLASALATDMIFKSESRTTGPDLLDLTG